MVTVNKNNAAIIANITKAMVAHDDVAVRLVYKDRKGVITRRIVSPMEFKGDKQFKALCLCREEPRLFELSQCVTCELISANDVLMPVPIEVFENGRWKVGE